MKQVVLLIFSVFLSVYLSPNAQAEFDCNRLWLQRQLASAHVGCEAAQKAGSEACDQFCANANYACRNQQNPERCCTGMDAGFCLNSTDEEIDASPRAGLDPKLYFNYNYFCGCGCELESEDDECPEATEISVKTQVMLQDMAIQDPKEREKKFSELVEKASTQWLDDCDVHCEGCDCTTDDDEPGVCTPVQEGPQHGGFAGPTTFIVLGQCSCKCEA